MNEPLFTLRIEQGGSRRAFAAMAAQWNRPTPAAPSDPALAAVPKQGHLLTGAGRLIRAWAGRRNPAPS